MQVLIKQLVALHQLRWLLMQLLVVTGQVVLVRLPRIEMLPMQLILLLPEKQEQQLL
ncbi:hypothetical protein D3C83_297930 [compost metagenome]